jgi:hypothetical protein
MKVADGSAALDSLFGELLGEWFGDVPGRLFIRIKWQSEDPNLEIVPTPAKQCCAVDRISHNVIEFFLLRSQDQ